MLVSPRDILLPAFQSGKLVGAFNTGNMEMTLGIIRAAEQANTPILLQIAEKRLPHSPLHLMAPMMVAAAKQASIPVAVQLDHGECPAIIEQAAQAGFTGIMFDGSHLPLDENIARTQAVRERYAAIWLEGEVGVLGGSEGGPEAEALHTCPAQAERYAAESDCDCLAVSIGNAHGVYQGEPKLKFAVLEEIRRRLPNMPLILHGGTGIAAHDLHRAAALGICKVNIATASFAALRKAAAIAEGDYFAMSEAMVQAVCDSTLEILLQLF